MIIIIIIVCARGQMATPTNYSACVRIRIQALNISRDKIFVVNVQPAKTAKIFIHQCSGMTLQWHDTALASYPGSD